MIDIKLGGVEAVLAMLARVAPDELIPPIALGVAEEARNEIAPYPAASGRPQPFRSAKSRRFFFAALRSGAISVPYRRGGPQSQALGRRWVISPTSSGADLVNTASYSDLVQNREKQAAYHVGTWKTDADVAEALERSGKVEALARDIVTIFITKAGL